MKTKLLLAAAAGLVIVAGTAGTAEARCHRVGHHWSCGYHHRHHYVQRWHHRSFARYGYVSPYRYGYGGGYSAYDPYGGRGFGPRPYDTGRY